ncbi:MAG: hypothetical protein AB1508_04150 [Pseudomonadota bacterium]|jgi:hypothetical protein
MAIYRLLKIVKFDAKQEALMKTAYEKALATAHIERNDPKTDLIASRIVHVVQRGESNMWHIVDFALQDLRKLH